MANLALQLEAGPDQAAPGEWRGAATGRIAFALFVMVTGVLYIRPAEALRALQGVPIYEALMIACMVAAAGVLVRQFGWERLMDNPITIAVIGVLACIVLSHAVRLDGAAALAGGTAFAKVLVYYLLVIGVVTTPARLRKFLFWLVLFLVVLTALPLLQLRGVINVAELAPVADTAVDASGEEVAVARLRGIGIFNDPNDLCQILAFAIPICLYWVTGGGSRVRRGLALGALAMFGWAVVLTRSRGGLIGVMLALLALFQARFGWRKTAVLSAVLFPALLWMVSGRQTDFSTRGGTAQQRVQTWSDALDAFRRHPIVGIGEGKFVEEGGLVAHNSFLHSYAELGFVGGTLFLGAHYLALRQMHRLRPARTRVLDPEMRRLQPYLLAGFVGYAGGMLSLSRGYEVPTYMVLGLAAAYLAMARSRPPVQMPRMSARLAWHVAAASVLVLMVMYVFVRMSVRWA